MKQDSRSVAAGALTLIVASGKSMDTVLAGALEVIADPRDRAFAQELVYGVLRWYWQLLPQLQSLLRRPLRARDREIEMLLLVGLYQIRYLPTPTHAAVDATVKACAQFNKDWAKGLLNATLRNAIRQEKRLDQIVSSSSAACWSHPTWLLEEIRNDWPAHWQSIATANNTHAPLTLRINERHGTRAQYLERLTAANLAGTCGRHAPSSIRLAAPVSVTLLPGFANGEVSVQDEAAQLAATLIQLPGSGKVLDACAAPGGKTAHLLECATQELEIVAIDRVEHRVERLHATMQRLGFNPTVYTADAADTESWWDGTPFDRILLDAPCSGSGVIRRHPDIKVLRRAADISNRVAQQIALLRALWQVLKPKGKLLYATCSVLCAENDQVIAQFTEGVEDLHIEPIDAQWGVATKYGRQIISGTDDMDGFYYARLAKT